MICVIYIILCNFGGRIRGDFEVIKGETPSPPSPCCRKKKKSQFDGLISYLFQ